MYKVGDKVLVKWNIGLTYKGTINRKLRKNWSVTIDDKKWHYHTTEASIPEHALVKQEEVHNVQ